MNRYLYHIYISLMAAIFLPLFSCSDDLSLPVAEQGFEYGLPARISLSFGTGTMPSVSRADMPAGRDSEINSIWLAFFDENGKKTHEFTWTDKSALASGTLDVEVVSGRYKMAAVANPQSNHGVSGSASGDLLSLLKAATTYSEYLNIALSTESGLIDTPNGNLVMQGIWVPDGTDTKGMENSNTVAQLADTYLEVPPSTKEVTVSSLPGKIFFRRAISQIKLNLSYNSDKISSFEPVSIQVFNVPMLSWLAERSDTDPATNNAGDILTAHLGDNASYSGNYHSSAKIFPAQLAKNGETYSLDWYQMENRRTGYCSTYSERELEDKNPTGANTGIYTALNKYASGATAHAANQAASFVTINVRMVMSADGSASSRTVTAKYTIHLGYCEGSSEADKARDFNCRRNHKYTYNVKINDINKIEVEAKREDQEYEHGAEGVVSVLANEIMTADAHYSVFNVKFTDAELQDFQWRIRAYHSPTGYYDISNENCTSFDQEYYNWVEFRPTESEDEDVIAQYKPRSGTSSDGKTYGLTDMNGKPGGIYTVFINEYVYESSTDNGTRTPNWKSYVNLPDRTVWLQTQEQRSTDGASIIMGAKYAIAQHSIQTYYGTDAASPATALGIEHVNEMQGLTMTYEAAPTGGTGTINMDARNLTWRAVSGTGTSLKNWSSLIENKFQEVNGANQSVPMYQEIVSGVKYYTSNACVNRNRDLNGNGKIDRNEMRWFVPSAQQYVSIVMGTQALASPLFDFSKYTPGTDATDKPHFAAIDNKMLLAEEGMTTSSVTSPPQYIRCVRYLGANMNEFPQAPIEQAFKRRSDDERIIDFYYAPEILRRYSEIPLPMHRITSDYNKPSRSFEYFLEDFSTNEWYESAFASPLSIAGWIGNIDSANPCDKYNIDGETGWRLPNQTELAAMLHTEVVSYGCKYASVTQSFFTDGGQPRVMGIEIGASFNNSRPLSLNDGSLTGSYIRCVRDIPK